MTKRYDKLSDNIVNINNAFSSKEEVMALMKERAKRIILPETKRPNNRQLAISNQILLPILLSQIKCPLFGGL